MGFIIFKWRHFILKVASSTVYRVQLKYRELAANPLSFREHFIFQVRQKILQN